MYLCTYVSMHLWSDPSTHSISRLAAGGTWEQFRVRLKMMIEWIHRYKCRASNCERRDVLAGSDWARVLRCTWWRRSRELRAALGGCAWVSWEMNWDAMIALTWRPWSSEFADALGGSDLVNQGCTWRLGFSECGDALRGHDQDRMREYMKSVDGRSAGWLRLYPSFS